LSPSQISELVWDSESEEETAALSDTTSEDEGGFEDEPGVSHLQLPAQHPVVKCPAFRYRQVLLTVFRMDQVSSGYGPLALREV